jgi:hypothetical protein
MAHDVASNSAPESVRLIDFNRAEVHPGLLPDTYMLTGVGTKPSLNV